MKSEAKLWLRTMRTSIRAWRNRFTPQDLADALRRLKIEPGDVVFVHSSWARFEGFTGNLVDALVTLQNAVGPTGTLLMSTTPYQTTTIEYVESGKQFDTRKTPSQMGLLSEMFRRSKGVLRSDHPTHPVAARGARAEELLDGHSQADTPCGRGTPYGRLIETGGKILFLGVPVSTMTFLHAVDEVMESRMPFCPFTSQRYEIPFVNHAGETVKTAPLRLFDPAWSRRRNVPKIVPYLQERGVLRRERAGGLELQLVEARKVLEVLEHLATSGIYFYNLDPQA